MPSKKKTSKAPRSAGERAEPIPAKETPPAPAREKPAAPPALSRRHRGILALLAVLFFLVTCFSTDATIKPMVIALVIVTVVSCLIRLSPLRQRLSLPMAAVFLWILVNGASTFYALSGKFALREFLRLLVGFCLFLLILAWSRPGRDSGRDAASVLTGGTAIASLISIDMLSTHFLSGPLFAFLAFFSNDFISIQRSGVEPGVRMTSLYENPNVFAGIVGLAVLLSLELAVTAPGKKERCFHLCCLFLNALSFLLAFSMGASGMILLAFLALLLLERRERKAPLIILMVETLVLALLGAFPIFLTAFDAWDGFQPVPLVCALAGCALLCLLDCSLGQKLSGALSQRGGKPVGILTALVLLTVGVYAGLALNLAGPATLAAGEGLSRAEYPQGGTYTLQVESSGPLTVTIESQDQRETMMHTSTVLYSGDAQNAVFTVPEDSLVTYFRFSAGDALTLTSASFSGEGGSTQLKLHYKLLPGFIANRVQGLFANENAIQRTVFFADGMKLFRRGPLFGLGLGTFENSIQGVQSFYYETKYAHNHYIETLVSTGVIGLIVFLGMLGLCALALWKNLRRKEQADPLAPALAAALLFMIGHAGVEVVFSFHFYLPMALGVLGLICLCCGGELPLLSEKEDAGTFCVLGICALMALFAIFLGLNMKAYKIATTNSERNGYRSLELAAKLDFFEHNDYMLSYVYMARDLDKEENWTVYTKANEYAQRLSKADSNTIPSYLANYYFSTGQPQEAIDMLYKFVDFVSADSEVWQTAINILEDYSYDYYPQCREAALNMYQKLLRWNEENMGTLTLSEENMSYLQSIQE